MSHAPHLTRKDVSHDGAAHDKKDRFGVVSRNDTAVNEERSHGVAMSCPGLVSCFLTAVAFAEHT